jgi:hypothetical protein
MQSIELTAIICDTDKNSSDIFLVWGTKFLVQIIDAKHQYRPPQLLY